MSIALINTKTREIVRVYAQHPRKVTIPDVGVVSPAIVGWEDHGHKLVRVTKATVPEGKEVATREFKLENDEVVEQITTRDIPAPVERTATEKVADMLAGYGLTLEDLKTVLASTRA